MRAAMRPRIGGARGVTHGLRVSRVPDCVGARNGWIEKSVALGFAQSMKHHHCIWSATFLGTPAVSQECYSKCSGTNFCCSHQVSLTDVNSTCPLDMRADVFCRVHRARHARSCVCIA